MNESERENFYEMWTQTKSMYNRDVSVSELELVFDCLVRFDVNEIRKAIVLHVNDTENGRFPIMPAHIVANIEGAGQERAAVAWNKFISAVVNVGPHEDVVFDDPAIHAIIQNEGGWVKVCDFSDEDMKYMQNRFNKQYITYVTRREFDYPRLMAGITNAANTGKLDDEGKELKANPPSIIGDKAQAGIVWQNGSVRTGQITHSHMVESIAKKLAAPEPTNTN